MTNVRVYWNLTRHCVSIQDAKTRRLIGYARHVTLSNVTFKVSEAVRQYVIRKNERCIHAWAIGTLTAADWIETKDSCDVAWTPQAAAAADLVKKRGRRVSYNPFKGPAFTIAGEPVTQTPELYLTGDKKADCYA